MIHSAIDHKKVCLKLTLSVKDIDNYLSTIYFDSKNPASYSGVSKLYRYVKKEGKYDISLKKIREWLSSQDGYSLQRQLKRNFKRPRVVVSWIDNQWDIDHGVFAGEYPSHNNGYKYFLLVIVVFSRFVWTRLAKLRVKKLLLILNLF